MLLTHTILTAISIINSATQCKPTNHPPGDTAVSECPAIRLPWIPQGRQHREGTSHQNSALKNMSSLHSPRLQSDPNSDQGELAAKDWVTSAPIPFASAQQHSLPHVPFVRTCHSPKVDHPVQRGGCAAAKASLSGHTGDALTVGKRHISQRRPYPGDHANSTAAAPGSFCG